MLFSPVGTICLYKKVRLGNRTLGAIVKQKRYINIAHGAKETIIRFSINI